MTRVRVAPAWLTLREPDDAAARAVGLVDELRPGLPDDRPLVIHDLACGSGAMMRWLAPQLPGPQRWVNHDLDAELLGVLASGPDPVAADGSPVDVQTRCDDVTRLDRGGLRHAALITGSAVLDLLDGDELHRFVETCASAGCAVLLTLTVTGRVRLDPPDRLDAAVAAAFNAHQRRAVAGSALLGPDAITAAERLFTELGREVVTRESPWRLGAASRALVQEWLDGWLAAAGEHDPGLAAALDDYARRRRAAAAAGRLRVVVEHRDLLVRPPLVDRRVNLR